jgi:acyl dehydratase
VKLASLQDVLAASGPLGASGWKTVARDHVASFTQATRLPFGTGAAPEHLPGPLVLALAASMVRDLIALDDVELTIIAGVRAARFGPPVAIGSKLRAQVVLRETSRSGRFVQAVCGLVYEASPPVAAPPCEAEIVLLFRAAEGSRP